MLLTSKRLVCIEAKFTSGNPLCTEKAVKENEKPKSKAAVMKKYIEENRLWARPLFSAKDFGEKVYSQLLRILVFTSTMAQLHDPPLDWMVVNLVSETQFK